MYKYVLLLSNGELSKRTNTTTQIGIEFTKSELELMQRVSGEEAPVFLQGLITNDINSLENKVQSYHQYVFYCNELKDIN